MSVLSIQSSVAAGHVGNGAALFALQRLGIETMALSTATLAHHPARGGWHGQITTPEALTILVDALARAGEFARCDAVLSGYLGDARLGPVLLDAVARVKSMNARALFCCDPVMGDGAKGFYVRPGIPEFFRDEALPRADLLTPNLFELAWLAEGATDVAAWTVARARDAARRLIARGPRLVVVTGLRQRRRGRAMIGALAVTAMDAWHAECPEVTAPASGTGDLFAALFLARRLQGAAVPRALADAVSSLHAVMAATRRRHADELALIPAQRSLVEPKRLFKAVQMG